MNLTVTLREYIAAPKCIQTLMSLKISVCHCISIISNNIQPVGFRKTKDAKPFLKTKFFSVKPVVSVNQLVPRSYLVEV